MRVAIKTPSSPFAVREHVLRRLLELGKHPCGDLSLIKYEVMRSAMTN